MDSILINRNEFDKFTKKLLNKVIYRNTTRNPENKIEIPVYNGDKNEFKILFLEAVFHDDNKYNECKGFEKFNLEKVYQILN